jgi:hypothetical protein
VRLFFPLLAVGTLAAIAVASTETSPRCTIAPGRALLLLYVERDTMLSHAEVAGEWMSASSVRRGPGDSLLAVQGTPMPGGRVRLLQMDSLTRDTLARAGTTDPRPLAFIRAAPYRADCRTIRWTDSLPWLERGDTGYARATLAPQSQWISGTPVFIIRDTWYYPYPRQRSLAYGVPRNRPLASAEAMYSLHITLEAARPLMRPFLAGGDTAYRSRAVEWARSHPADAELEPARQLVRQAILGADWSTARRIPSRLRGSYQLTMESDGARATWYFRTHDRPGYRWEEADTIATTAELLVSPHVFGYVMVAYAAETRDALVSSAPTGMRDLPLVWLAAADRPTVRGNETRHVLRGELMFRMAAAPNQLWDALDMFVPPLSSRDSLVLARSPHLFTRENRQPRLPLTIRVDGTGAVRADTSLTVNGKTLRVSVVRLDTISVRSRY